MRQFDTRWITFPLAYLLAIIIGDVSIWVILLILIGCFPVWIKI